MLKIERIICKLFSYPAPIVFVVGRFGFGKTDFALLIAETLLKYGIIKKFGSNIRVDDALGYDYAYITNLVRLKEWLYPKRIPKLFILDEAGVHADRRNPAGKINRQLRYIGFLLRKFSGKFIFISQREKDIESTFEDTDIWLATFRKVSLTKAELRHNLSPEKIYLKNIPPTNFKFDTTDIALFTAEPNYQDLEAETFERRILYDWLELGNYGKVAKKHNLHIQQVKRIILKEVKAILEARIMEEPKGLETQI